MVNISTDQELITTIKLQYGLRKSVFTEDSIITEGTVITEYTIITEDSET